MKSPFSKYKGLIVATILLSTVFFMSPVLAEISGAEVGGAALGALGGAVTIVVGTIALILVSVIGIATTFLVWIMIQVAQFNGIIGADPVVFGWVIVRDLCNMFFILVLLIIAFATILRQDSAFNVKIIPKLLIMAILINFSKTIFGLLIDFSQIVMLTFVSSFKDGGGYFIDAFRVQSWLSLSKDGSTVEKAIDQWSTVVAIILGVIAAALTFVIVSVLLSVLVMRIIMLWIYTILSPLVFLGFAIPAIGKYTGQIWQDFSKQLIVGPMLAFFMWLALSTASGNFTFTGNNFQGSTEGDGSKEICAGAGAFFCGSEFQKFIITIGLLMGGLAVTQSMGGAIAKAAGFGDKWSKKGFSLGGKGISGAAGYGARKFAAWDKGFEIRPTKIWDGVKQSFKRTAERDDMAAKKRADALKGKGGFKAILGGAGVGADWADEYLTGFLNIQGFKNMGRSIKWNEKKRGKVQEEIDNKRGLLDASEKVGGYAEYQSPQEMELRKHKIEDKEKKLKDINSNLADARANNASEEVISLLENQKKTFEDEKKKLEEKNKLPISEERGKVMDEINKLKEDLISSRPSASFEVRAGYRSMVNAEKAKMKDSTNSDELLILYDDAVRRKDKYRAGAILEKLAEDSNENEALNAKGYSSTAIGLHKFIKEQIVESGLMTKEEGLQLQNDISEIAERKNHWEVAKTVGVNESGSLVSLIKEKRENGKVIYDDSEHVVAAASEIYKMDPQGIVRSLNRLSFGGEHPHPDGSREFDISNLGKVLVKGLSAIIEKQESRLLANTAFNLAQPHVLTQLKDIGINQNISNIFITKGMQKSGVSNSPGEVLKYLKGKGFIKELEEDIKTKKEGEAYA